MTLSRASVRRLINVRTLLILIFCAVSAPLAAQWKLTSVLHDDYQEMVWDPGRGVFVGYYQSVQDGPSELWETSGAGWRLVKLDGPRLRNPVMIHDPVSLKVFIIGGVWLDAGYSTVQVWSWDGTKLTLQSKKLDEQFSSRAPIAYSPTMGGIVLVGKSTWVWRKNSWELISPHSLPFKDTYAVLLSCDSRRGQLYLFRHAGNLSPGTLYDVYRFESGAWVKRYRIEQRLHPYSYVDVQYDHAMDQFVFLGRTQGHAIETAYWDGAQAFSSILLPAYGIGRGDLEFNARSLETVNGVIYCSTDAGVFRMGVISWSPMVPNDHSVDHITTSYLPRLIFDSRRDVFILCELPQSELSELHGAHWRKQELLPAHARSVAFHPGTGKTWFVFNTPFPSYKSYAMTWDGQRWSRIGGGDLHTRYPGELFFHPVDVRMYFFTVNDDHWIDFRAPEVWTIEKGGWRLLYKDTENRWDEDYDFYPGAYDWVSGKPLLPGLRRQIFTWDGSRLFDTGSYPLPFECDGLISRPNARPIALGLRDYNTRHIWEWSGNRWQRALTEPYREAFSRRSTATFDSLRHQIVVLTTDSQRQHSLWSYGPYSGPTSGNRRLNNRGVFPMFFNRVSSQWNHVTGKNPLQQQGVFPFLGDFDGDGHAQRGTFDPFTGYWRLENARSVRGFGQPGDLPVIGDYDGDGADEIAVFRPLTGEWLTRHGRMVILGSVNSTPVPADYDGDGKTDPAVYSAVTGTWTFADGSALKLGNIDSWPVPADYDGDGVTEPAVWERSTGMWKTEKGILATFGLFSDIPAPGKYMRFEPDMPALYRPSTGEWINGSGEVRVIGRNLQPVW